MRVKKYLVKSVNEGIAKIKLDLGSNAVIISQRKVRQEGIKGFFLPKVIEITAVSEGGIKTNDSFGIEGNIVNKISKTNKKTSLNSQKKVINKEYDSIGANLAKEVADMKSILKNMANENKNDGLNDGYKNYRSFLEENDISKEFLKYILETLKEKSIEDNEINKDLLKEIICDYIKNDLCEEEVITNKVIAFVGPTGVGKTTTIAKLAGKYTLIHKKKVGLITVDTYRIGAVEQLKTYAEIMNIPFKVVFDMKEMEETIESMSDCDTIFVDTTGRSSKNLMQLQELRAFVTKSKAEKVFLVLSSTTKPKDVTSIIEGYKIMKYNGLIITKLDETTTYGSMLTMIHKAQVPLTYITTGQNVPQDILNIKKEGLLKIILGEDNVC